MAENNKHVLRREQNQNTFLAGTHRLRTGMYNWPGLVMARTYDDGCYILLKEVVDNAIDEFIMGHVQGSSD